MFSGDTFLKGSRLLMMMMIDTDDVKPQLQA